MILFEHIRTLKYKIINRNTDIHSSVVMSKGSDISVVKGLLSIGKGSFVGSYSHLGSVGGKLIIGSNVFINRNCVFVSRDQISIGEETIIGPNVMIYDHNHEFSHKGVSKDRFRCDKIIIGKGCWIGAGCIILKGSIIGEGSVVSAGTIVNGKIPPNSIVRPNILSYRVEELHKL